ncbi:MAG: COX15/CtaA family protein [Neomegalonema sp.]|nr:COX15/CtaA family protein [Neomegalonema sp.]
MSRSIFEEVGEDKPEGQTQRQTKRPGERSAQKARARGAISIWLLVLAVMVVAQILVGGLTRLTDSGLSITEWRPVTGAIPPLSDAAWAEEFAKYQGTTEFQQQNHQMSLAEFKSIYWWEWGHRQWGRLIGLVFIIGFAWFALRKMIPAGWMGKVLFVGGLGALQGVIGWWMVASGLVGRLDVSQYRLAVHLSLAFLILAFLLWFALTLRREDWEVLQARRRREKGLLMFGDALTVLLLIQIALGGFVAGMDGGMVYSEWPMMAGSFYPAGEPFNPFENPAAAQWLHRWFAIVVLVAGIVYFFRCRQSPYRLTKRRAHYFVALLAVQVVVGIMTLVHVVPLSLGLMHQALAVALFGVHIWAKHQTAFPAEEKIAG